MNALSMRPYSNEDLKDILNVYYSQLHEDKNPNGLIIKVVERIIKNSSLDIIVDYLNLSRL